MGQLIEVPGLGPVEFPDGMTDDQISAAIRRSSAPNPAEGMSGLQKAAAGAGKAVADLGRGARQVSTEAAERFPFAVPEVMRLLAKAAPFTRQDAAEQRVMDAPLMESGAAKAGNVAGSIAAFVPSMFVPGANTYTGAGLLGATSGLLQPVTEGESRGMNTTVGAGAGLAGQAVGNTVGRLIKPVQSTLPAADQKLADAATRNNIPLSPGQLTGSRPLQITESVMENLPFTSGPQLAAKDAQAKAFNQAVLSKAGIVGDDASAPVLAAQKSALGGKFSQIAGRNSVDFNQGNVLNDLAQISSEGSRRLSNPDPLKNTIDDIIADAANGPMAGEKYQGWRETLGRLAKGNGTEAHYFGQVKKALDNAFNSQVPAADAALWKQTGREYANLKTISNAMGGAGAGTKTGNIPPAQLETAFTSSMGKEGKALGRGDLNELVGVGRKFVSDNIPNSGTAQRQLFQSLMTGGGGAGIGAAGALATGNNPLEGAAVGASLTAGGLLAPRGVQALMNSPAGRAYLTRGLLNLTPAELAAINAATRSGAIGLIGDAGQ